MYKICSTCNIEKELNSDNFEPRNKTKDGFRNQCRDCRNEEKRSRYHPSENNNRWTNQEIEILVKYYPYLSAKEMSKKHLEHRTPEKIMDYATKKLNLQKDTSFHSRWNENQIEYLKNNYTNFKISVDEISEFIGKSKYTVIAMANSLGLYKDTKWSDNEKLIVRQYYPYMKTDKLKEEFLPEKTIAQITGFANANDIFKTDELRSEIRINTAINNLKSVNGKKEPTKPEVYTIKLLEKLNIEYIFQDFKKYYWVDFYLPEHNLIIEVQGDYFHSHPLMNFTYKALDKNKIVTKDKRKHSYFKNKNINVLYLWESDIIRSMEKCELLIKSYIDTNGHLENYHSFNFSLINGALKENPDEIVIGY